MTVFAVVFGLALASADVLALPQSDTTSTTSGKNRVRISIDKSGISVEGEGAATVRPDTLGDDDGWVDIRDIDGARKDIGQDLVRIGSSAFVAKDEVVLGGVTVVGGDAVIEGRVMGDVVVLGGTLRARDNAQIGGDAYVVFGLMQLDDGVVIEGEKATIGASLGQEFDLGGSGKYIILFGFGVLLFAQLILTVLVMLLLRDRVLSAASFMRNELAKSVGVGVLTFTIGSIAATIVSIILLITFVLFPVAMVMSFASLGVLAICWTVGVYYLGLAVRRGLGLSTTNPFVLVILGTIVAYLPFVIASTVTMLPFGSGPAEFVICFLGCVLVFIAGMGGLGALVLSQFGGRSATREEPA